MALVVAVVVAVVVVLLSTAAIEQSVDTISQASIAGKQVSSTDASEAGIQTEYHQIVTQAQTQQTSFTCPTTLTTLATTGPFTARYQLLCSVAVGSATCVSGASGSCTLSSGATYLIQSTGTTTANAIGSKTLVARVSVPSGLSGAKSPYFPEAVYAGTDLGSTNPAAFAVSKTTQNLTYAGGLAASTGGDTYSGNAGQCTSTTSIGNNYYDLGEGLAPTGWPSSFSGTCSVAGDVIMDNTNGVSLSGGTGIGGNLWTTGPVSLTGSGASASAEAQMVGGNIYSDGPISICPATGYDVVSGSITTGTMGLAGSLANPGSGITFGGTSACPSPTIYVGGDINSDGPITGSVQAYGSFGTYANGPITLTNSHINGVTLGEQAVTLTNTSVTGVVYAGGAMTLTGVTVPSVQGLGAVTLSGGTYGSVDSVGPLTIKNGATVTGTIYAEDGVNFVGGTIGSIEDEYGTIACNNNHMGGALYYYAATLQNCTAGTNGPTSIHSYLLPFNSQSAAGGAPPDDYPPQSGLGINGVGGFNSSDEVNTAAAIATATKTAANTIDGTPGGINLVATFPLLTYDPNAWYANNNFCGQSTAACTTTNMTQATVTNCSSLASTVTAAATSGLPTVIVTACPYTPTGTGLGLDNNLAILDSGGINIPSSFVSGFSSGDGNNHQLYLIVPTGSVATPNGCGFLGDTFPSIVVDAPLTDSSRHIQDFLYTPGSICNQGSNPVSVYGKAYAGLELQPATGSGSWSQVFSDISPWAATAGSAGVLGTPSIVSIVQTANPSGFS